MSNTVTAYFKGRVGVAEALYQNDYGIVMAFDGIDLPAHFDCYFTVPGSDTAIPGVGADSRVVIPNAVLANSGKVVAHIPLHTGDNDSEVEYIVYFKVIGRARPEDDGTPVQMTAIEQALALLQTPIGNIEQIVNEALSFTGETFDEMQEDLDEWKNGVEGGLTTWKSGVESDFDVLQGQFDTAVAAVTTDTEVTDIRVGADGITDTTAGASVRRQFTDLKSDLSEIDTSSIYQKNYVEGYYLSRQGTLVEDANYCVSEKIPLYTFVNASYYYGTGYDSALKINICSYKADGTFIDYWGPTSGSESRAISSFGTGVSYVRFSYVKGYANAHLGTAAGSVDNIVYWKPTDVVGDVANKTNGEKPKVVQWTSVNSNAVHKLCHNSLRSPKIFVYAKFSSFDAIEVGHGQTGQYTQYFKIDGTNVTFYTHGSEGSSIAHGLTFSEYIGVVIDVAYNNNYKITINTIGGTWSREMVYPNPWQGNKGETFVKNNSSVITYLSIGEAGDYQFNKWMFGDSYLTNYSDARWAYYLNEYDIPYTMINAFPGENSGEAYIDWLDALMHGTPKFAIWCLGMNDPDDGAINSSWLAVIQMFIDDCQKRGITPILATIPNTPSYTHTYKNAWVKSSGYRYIDFAEAVGAETSGSTWYDGCLETGAVRTHPTVDGAKLLFMRAIQDFPEFFQK